MNSKNTSGGCNGLQQGSNCVTWTGQDIPAIGISKGMNITQAMCAIATSIEAIAAPMDLSSISLQCLKDKLSITEPAERSIATMIQIAYDSGCTLKTLIDQLTTKVDATTTTLLVLDLKCLASFDQYGNPLPYDQQSVLQLLLNTACSQGILLNSLSGQITTINAEISALQSTPVYTEPVLNSCLFSGRKTSDAVVLTASALCGYQTVVGQQTDVQGAMSQVPTNFSTLYGQLPNWIINPSNLAQSYSNLVIAFANLLTRVTTIETTCCAASCDKVVVDFDIKLSDDRTQATLFFATKSSVPTGFTETNPLGSKLTITDGDGNVFTTYIKVIPQITNPDGIVIDLNASPIDSSTDYTFNMNVTLTNGTTTCVKCITHTATFKDTCSFCQVTVFSASKVPNSSDKIVLIYTTPNSTTLQYLSINAGQTQVIPKGAVVSSILAYGTATYTSTCGSLPNPSQTSCYELSYAFSKSINSASPALAGDVLKYIAVLGTSYNVGVGIDLAGLTTAINTLYPVTIGLMANPIVISAPSTDLFGFKIYFQTTSDIAATIEGYLSGTGSNGAGDGFDGGAYIKAIAVDPSNCPALTSNPIL